MKTKRLTIGGVSIRAGEEKDIKLPISQTYTGDTVNIPLHVIRSKKEGPRVFITAAIHGDELNGTGIIHDFLHGAPLELDCGTLILAPVINVFGFESHERYLPDRRDLNRSFPGSASGSLASRMAHTLMREIVSNCDYGIDLHTAAFQRTNYPNVRADLNNQETRNLALAVGCALVVDGKGPVGSFRREATKSGTPTIILEAGEPWKIEPSVLQIGVRGIRNCLRAFGMIGGEMEKPPYQAYIRKTTWLRATVGGILKFHLSPGDFVVKDQPVATNYTIYGKEQNTICSPGPGIMLSMITMPAVNPGEPISHLASLTPSQLKRYQKQLQAANSQDPHAVAHRDLAKNIDVVESS